MTRKLPKSFTSTPEEDEFFEREKAASAPVEEEPVEETAVEEEPVEESEEAPEETPDESADEEAPETDEKPSRTVPIGALHEEREKRRQLQAKIEQMEQTFQKLVDRVQQPMAAPAPPPAPDIPSYESDPVGHVKARLDALSQQSTVTTQHIQQQSAMQKFVDALGTLEGQMRATTPDYDDAINFAKQSRYEELAALGYSPEASAEMMRQEILGTAAYCMQQGRNPVEAFYNYAKVRGWNGPNGQPPAKPTVATTAKKLATVARAQSATKALPKGGSAPPAARTLEDLATMEDKDFDKYFDSIMRKT